MAGPLGPLTFAVGATFAAVSAAPPALPLVNITAVVHPDDGTDSAYWGVVGVTDARDAAAVWVANNGTWPLAELCPTGMLAGYEVWTKNGSVSQGPTCWTNLKLAAGDRIEVTLAIGCGANGSAFCFEVQDVTRSTVAVTAVTAPDSGNTQFVTSPSPTDANGDFTGVFTGIADPLAASCGTVAALPYSDFEVNVRDSHHRGGNVTSAVVWLGQATTLGTGCSSHETTIATPATSTTSYWSFNANNSSPHWLGVQNDTDVPTLSGSWRLESEVSPLTNELSVGRATADDLQTVSAAASASGGRGPLTFDWTAGGTALPTHSASISWSAAGAGAVTLTAQAVDRDLNYAPASATVTVSSDPSVALGAAPGFSGKVNGSAEFWANVTGGSGGDSIAWTSLPAGCSNSAGPTVTCTLAAPGNFTLAVQVNDSNGYLTLASTTYSVHYNGSSGPAGGGGLTNSSGALSLHASAGQVDVGVPVTFSAALAGSAAAVTYVWRFGDNATSSNASPTHAFATPGEYSVQVTVRTANGSVSSSQIPLRVDPTPQVEIILFDYAIPANSTLATSPSVSLSVKVAGGTTPYSETWSLGDGTTASGSKVQHQYAATGSYSVALAFVDAGGFAASYPFVLAVTPTVPGPSHSQLITDATIVLLGTAGLLVLVAVVRLSHRRRRNRPPAGRPPASASSPPPPGTPIPPPPPPGVRPSPEPQPTAPAAEPELEPPPVAT
ncbi:MAG TPA: PKD domain-containing protein [Thermoplasmata archaeon]|nr:PKD domain-containing protein [Thermoplasmata archaeon]